MEYIYNLPKEITYIVEGKKIYISHYPMNEDGSFKKHFKIANIEENKEMFLGIDADIYLYGHTHRNIYNIEDNKIYINPGSVGCPEGTNNAWYGILNIKNNKIEYKQETIGYNKEEVINTTQLLWIHHHMAEVLTEKSGSLKTSFITLFQSV